MSADRRRRPDALAADGTSRTSRTHGCKQGGGGQISRDGHSVLVQFTIKGDPDTGEATGSSRSSTRSPACRRRIRQSRSARSATRARTTSSTSASTKDFANARAADDPDHAVHPARRVRHARRGRAARCCSPFSAVLASLGLFAAHHATSYAGDYQSTSAVVLLIGMAVGVDYSLFYLRREREERADGTRAASRAAARGVDLRPGRADLGRDGADRDGRHVHRRQPDLHRRWRSARCSSSSAR